MPPLIHLPTMTIFPRPAPHPLSDAWVPIPRVQRKRDGTAYIVFQERPASGGPVDAPIFPPQP